MMFISVDLPLPEGPMTLTNSFGKMCSVTWSSAWTRSSPIW